MQLVVLFVNEFVFSLGCIMKWLFRMIVGFFWNRYLNDFFYYGGFEQEDFDQFFFSMRLNFSVWVLGFVIVVVGIDIYDEVV